MAAPSVCFVGEVSMGMGKPWGWNGPSRRWAETASERQRTPTTDQLQDARVTKRGIGSAFLDTLWVGLDLDDSGWECAAMLEGMAVMEVESGSGRRRNRVMSGTISREIV
jgi:hypothetical protein